MDHQIDMVSSKELFIITTHGDGSVEGIIAFLQDLIHHPQWRPGMKVLLDHRKLLVDQIDATGISEVSHFFKNISDEIGAGMIALVMNRDIDFGIARAWELMTEEDVSIKIRVFRQYEKAAQWLDV